MSIESLKWSLEHKVLFKRQLNSTGTRRRTVGQPHRYRQIKDIKGALFFSNKKKVLLTVPVILYLFIGGFL